MTTLKDIGHDAAWDAVARRDPDLDGRILYAVTTTGIYCKPSCPARRPRRANVRFFSDHEAARAAGFRPCKRCHPDGDDPLGEVVRRAQTYLHDHLDDGVTLEDLGREVGMSPTHLQRTFKARIGMSPKEYVRAVRTKRLKSALREGDSTVTRTTFEAGFGSASAAYAAADAYLGMTPATYGAGGRGAHIRYAVVPCQLGHLLAAVTTRGVCAVTLGNPPGALERALRTEFSMGTIERERSGELHTPVRTDRAARYRCPSSR
jgi:AraC family transcriptional regulator, regulatory protein of adaptative response / methylated-DNA-[protein]-cysteine methyltransferase